MSKIHSSRLDPELDFRPCQSFIQKSNSGGGDILPRKRLEYKCIVRDVIKAQKPHSKRANHKDVIISISPPTPSLSRTGSTPILYIGGGSFSLEVRHFVSEERIIVAIGWEGDASVVFPCAFPDEREDPCGWV